MSEDQGMTLTSVKIKSKLFQALRIECVKRKFSFQKLSDRTIHLFLTDPEFRKMITNYTNLDYEEK